MKISIIGTGQVARALAKVFKKAGHELVCFYGRNQKKSRALAEKFQCLSAEKPEELARKPSDVIIISVSDDAIGILAAKLGKSKSLVIHTSGSVPLSVLTEKNKRCGVFYPLQTFSPGSKINYKTMPVCIETNQKKDLQLLLSLGHSISEAVYVTDSVQRLHIHLAAVIANNFSNHLYVMAEKILHKQHLSFDLLKPIILTQAKNIQFISPAKAQTGPARRQDLSVLRKHMAMIKTNPSWHTLYQLFSDDISVVNEPSPERKD